MGTSLENCDRQVSESVMLGVEMDGKIEFRLEVDAVGGKLRHEDVEGSIPNTAGLSYIAFTHFSALAEFIATNSAG